MTLKFGASGTSFANKPFTCPLVPGSLVTYPNTTSILQCTMPNAIGANLVFQILVGQQTSLESVDTISFPAPFIIADSLRLSPASNTPSTTLQGQDSQGQSGEFLRLIPSRRGHHLLRCREPG